MKFTREQFAAKVEEANQKRIAQRAEEMAHPFWFHHYGGVITDEHLAAAEKAGMVARKDLAPGYYSGLHRRTHVAYWDEQAQEFVLLTHEFGAGWQPMTAKHPADNRIGNEAGFIPLRRIEKEKF